MDDIDLAILSELQANGRITLAALGRTVGLSEAPVQRRVRALERDGWIDRYVALVNATRAQRSCEVFLEVYLEAETARALGAFESGASALPEVVECHRVAGESRYLLKVVTRDLEAFNHLYVTELLLLPNVLRTRQFISLVQVKSTTALPLPRTLRDF